MMGRRLSIEDIRNVATGDEQVTVERQAAVAVADLYRRVAASDGLPVYGRTTGVGANRTTEVAADDADHGMRLLRSHAVEYGPTLSRADTRAMLAVRLNQLGHPGSGIRPDILEGLERMLNTDALPTLHVHAGSIGTADLSALARTALTLVGELPATHPFTPLAPFGVDSALPFMSSSALTLGQAALLLGAARDLQAASDAVFALTARAVAANAQHWSAEAADATVSPGCHAVAERIRRLLAGSALPAAARVQDPYGIRAYAITHGALTDTVDRAADTVEGLVSVAQENPVFTVADDGVKVTHHAGFFQVGLALELDALTNALAAIVPLATARVRMLGEPAYTGLGPFLATGPAGASGTMIVEYVVAAAGAEMRAAAMPAAAGTTVLSRGAEEDATFAPQSVAQVRRSLDAWRVMLAAELLNAVRALRQRGLVDDVPADVVGLLRREPGLWADDDDHDLGPALEACDRLLDALAGHVVGG